MNVLIVISHDMRRAALVREDGKAIHGPDLPGFEVVFGELSIGLDDKKALTYDVMSGRGTYAWEERLGGLFVAVAMLKGESVEVRVTG